MTFLQTTHTDRLPFLPLLLSEVSSPLHFPYLFVTARKSLLHLFLQRELLLSPLQNLLMEQKRKISLSFPFLPQSPELYLLLLFHCFLSLELLLPLSVVLKNPKGSSVQNRPLPFSYEIASPTPSALSSPLLIFLPDCFRLVPSPVFRLLNLLWKKNLKCLFPRLSMNLAEFPLTVLPVLLFPDDALLLLLLKIVFPTSLFLALSYLPLFLPLHFLLKKLQDLGKNLPVL